MASDREVLKRLCEHTGRLVECCRLLATAAASIERQMAPVPPAAGRRKPARSSEGEPPTLALGEVRHICETAHGLKALYESTIVSIALQAALCPAPARQDSRSRVLVVDDSSDLRDLLTVVLENAGFEVSTANDGLEAVLVAHTIRPSVVLMDLSMPVIDGVDATRMLKASPATHQVPVIAHTARPQVFQDMGAERLFADVIRKPASPPAVVEMLQRHAQV